MKPAFPAAWIAAAALLLAAPAGATPLLCVSGQKKAPFLEAIMSGRVGGEALWAHVPEEGEFANLVRRALAALEQGEPATPIRPEEAQNLADAALTCLERARTQLTELEDAPRALSYLAALALHRQMTDPAASETAPDAARRLLAALNGVSFSGHEAARRRAVQIGDQAQRLVGPGEEQDKPLRARVDSRLAQLTALGDSQTMEEYLARIQAPAQERIRLLKDIALARTSARIQIEGVIAPAPQAGAAAEEDLSELSAREREILAQMRRDFVEDFKPVDGVIAPRVRAAPERLATMRRTLEARGADRRTVQGFCVTGKSAQEDCLREDAVFDVSGAYPPDPRLAALTPFRLLDQELRLLSEMALGPFLARFESAPSSGSVEALRRVQTFVRGLIATPQNLFPTQLNEYRRGEEGLNTAIFLASEAVKPPDFCAPSAAAARRPRVAPGQEELQSARRLVAGFLAEGEAAPEGADLAGLCEILRALARDARE